MGGKAVKKVLFIYIILSVWVLAMPQAILHELKKSKISRKDVSIYIKEAGNGGKVVASWNANTTRTPASVIKVLTTYASLLKLGFEYRFPTKVYTTGTIKNGILRGDLLIKGFGDPTLDDKDLESIVSEIASKGIKEITGNIIIDRSYFKVSSKNTSGFDKNIYSAYNAMPDAMMFNERISTVCITPKKRTSYKKGSDGSYRMVDKLHYVNKPCKGKYSWPGVKIDQSSSVPTVILQGSLSSRCYNRNVCNVITKPYESFYYALKAKLHSRGVSVKGRLTLQKIPSTAKLLHTHYSDRLEKIVSKTAKKSNNLYARHLLLTLGAKLYGAPASLQKGRDAVGKILRDNGALGHGTLMIDNGSGLSRIAKITAKNLGDMYDNAYDRYGYRWMKTLSIAGVDGTIRRRFKNTSVKNHAWMKTGTLNRVKNIGGYVKNRAGKLYTVVILVNSTYSRYHGAKLQNEIIKWLSTTTAKPTKRGFHSKIEKEKITPPQSSAGNYYIQVGSFTQMPSSRYLEKVKALDLRYSIRHTDTYRVLIGSYEDKSSASKALKKVQHSLNKSAFIVKL